MRKYVIALTATMLAAPVMAETAKAPPTCEEQLDFSRQANSALQAQRNQSQDQAATLAAQLAQAQNAVTALEKQVADLKTKYEPEKPEKKEIKK